MRYFVKMSRGEPYNLYRFDVINEQRWYPTQGWTPTRVISAYLVMGEGDYEEITEALATEYFPDAFGIVENTGTYQVSKAEEAKRYTLGAMYIPDKIDAHGEWTDSNELQRAVWDYVKSNDRRIRLQHNRDVVAGEWVEVMSFPYELTVPIQSMSGIEVDHTYPPNTVFLGVIWEPWAWDLVKSGKILGYSIGGKAERLYVDMEKDATVNDVHVDTIMNPKKKKKVSTMEKPDPEELVIEKEKPLDIEALTKTIIESIKKEIPAPAPVVVEKAPDMEAMMIRLAEIFAANQPVINVTLPEEKAKNRIIERDEFGNISRIVEEE